MLELSPLKEWCLQLLWLKRPILRHWSKDPCNSIHNLYRTCSLVVVALWSLILDRPWRFLSKWIKNWSWRLKSQNLQEPGASPPLPIKAPSLPNNAVQCTLHPIKLLVNKTIWLWASPTWTKHLSSPLRQRTRKISEKSSTFCPALHLEKKWRHKIWNSNYESQFQSHSLSNMAINMAHNKNNRQQLRKIITITPK